MPEWTWIDSVFENMSEEDIEYLQEIRGPAAQIIADKINHIELVKEQRRFRMISESEGDIEYDSDEADDLARQTERDIEDKQLELLHEALHNLGARMMRQYEHWGEEERRVEFEEEERFGSEY